MHWFIMTSRMVCALWIDGGMGWEKNRKWKKIKEKGKKRISG